MAITQSIEKVFGKIFGKVEVPLVKTESAFVTAVEHTNPVVTNGQKVGVPKILKVAGVGAGAIVIAGAGLGVGTSLAGSGIGAGLESVGIKNKTTAENLTDEANAMSKYYDVVQKINGGKINNGMLVNGSGAFDVVDGALQNARNDSLTGAGTIDKTTTTNIGNITKDIGLIALFVVGGVATIWGISQLKGAKQ